jgi:hypothetical protein
MTYPGGEDQLTSKLSIDGTEYTGTPESPASVPLAFSVSWDTGISGLVLTDADLQFSVNCDGTQLSWSMQ